MNNPWKHRCSSRATNWFAGLIFSLFACHSALAGEAPELRPYQAEYEVTIDGEHVANATLRLDLRISDWLWSLTFEPIGLYRWLSRNSSITQSQTRFDITPGGLRLLSTIETNASSRTSENTGLAYFDWNNQQLIYQKGEKHHSLAISPGLLNYDTIYWLLAKMRANGTASEKIQVFYRGKLKDSQVTYEGETTLDINGTAANVAHFSQKRAGSKSRFDYYIDERNLAPVRIIKTRKQKKTVMTLVSFTTRTL